MIVVHCMRDSAFLYAHLVACGLRAMLSLAVACEMHARDAMRGDDATAIGVRT